MWPRFGSMLLASALGCGDDEAKPASETPAELVCSVDADCTAGTFCGLQVALCNASAGVEPLHYAVEAACRTECETTACGPCQSDADCGKEERCNAEGACALEVFACMTPTSCPEGCPLTDVAHGCRVCLCNALDCGCNACP
jgi:hypothetical protein